MASRRVLSRTQRGPRLYVGICVLVAVLFGLQQTWWATSAFATIAAIYITIMLKARRGATRLTRRLGQPEVTVSADDGGIAFEMPFHQSRTEWMPLLELWTYDDVWIFLPYGPSASYSAIPTSAMTPEFRETVLAGMRAQGAPVR